MMADSVHTRILGTLKVCSCVLLGGCRVQFLMHTPYCTFDRWRFGLRKIGMLHTLSASCVSPLWLHASLPRTYDWLFSLMSASCLGLRPPAAMTDGWFPSVQAVSSAGLCNTFLKLHSLAFLLGTHWRRLLWACMCLPSLRCGQPSAAAPEANGLYAGQAGSLKDFFVWHMVLPFDATDRAQAVLMKPLK